MELYDYIAKPLPPPPPKIKETDKWSTFGHVFQDMYPNSPSDSKLWIDLFMLTANHDIRLTEILEYIRTVGANLIPNEQYGFCIQPIIDITGALGWSSLEQYNEERKYLMPYQETILECLKILRRVHNEERRKSSR